MNTQSKYERQWHAHIAEEVEKVWNVVAPFPSKSVIDKYRRWKRYDDEIARVWRNVENADEKRKARVYRDYAEFVRKRDKLAVPKKYLSWAHIEAFLKAEADARYPGVGMVAESDHCGDHGVAGILDMEGAAVKEDPHYQDREIYS